MTISSRMLFRSPRGIALRIVIVMVALMLSAGSQARAAEASADAERIVDRLLQLIDERLAVAPDVAKAKWNSGASIDAPTREAQILDRVVVEASRAGVDETFAQAFFQHQFDASKIIQHRLHDQWRQAGRPPFEAAPDLAADIRPELDRLTPQLIVALRSFQHIAENAGIRRYLESRAEVLVDDNIGGAAREVALSPLFEAIGS